MSDARFYLIDDDKARGLPPRTMFDVEEATRANRRGMGVFWCPNLPRAPERRIQHVGAPRFIYVDLDDGAKADQLAALDASPVLPARVVETKRGYQAYWRVDDLTLDAWGTIVRRRLVPYFGADKRAADPVRLLRVPGFDHMKNPADPFRITIARRRGVRTTVAELVDAFPEVALPVPRPAPIRIATDSDDILAAVASLDARAALERLSGSPLVRREQFTFRPTTRGRWNIFCDGKASSCFIDEAGRIGGGGGLGAPTAVQWITYYYGGKPTTSDWRAIASELRHVFPELDVRSRRAA